MSDLHDLQAKVIAFRDERNWKQFHNPKDLAISLVLEATELLEHMQWKTDQEFADHLGTKGEEVAAELADVLYWVLLIAHDLGIDLPVAFDKKMAQNIAKYPVAKAKNSHKKYNEL